MSRIIVLISAVLIASSVYAQSVPAVGTSQTLDVATWNIEHFGNDGADPADARQFQNVKQVILESEIDLWAVQEIEDPDDFRRLLAELGPEYGGELDRSRNSLRTGFIFRTDAVRVRSIANMTMSEDQADYFAGRPPLQMQADVTVGGVTQVVTFIVLHMKAFDDTQSYERRKSAAVFLKNRIDFTMLNTANVVVLGDWNDELTNSITNNRPSPYANFIDDPEDYSFVTYSFESAGKNTFCFSSNCTSGSTIDHILITNELFEEFVDSDVYDELLASLGSYVSTTSDHLPAFARFNLGIGSNREETPAAEFHIRAIVPNPTSTGAEVDYSLSTGGWVRLEAFDMLGRRVAVLRDAFTPAGRYVTRIPTEQFAPGSYTIRLVTGSDAVATRLLVVL